MYFAMAKERLFFDRFAYVHPRYRVPSFSIILQTVWACALALVGSFERLFSYVIFIDWLFYGMGGVAVLVLRWRRPNLERPYRVWGYPWVPILFSLGAFLVVLNTVVYSFKDAFWGLVVVATGLPAFWHWSRNTRRSTAVERE